LLKDKVAYYIVRSGATYLKARNFQNIFLLFSY